MIRIPHRWHLAKPAGQRGLLGVAFLVAMLVSTVALLAAESDPGEAAPLISSDGYTTLSTQGTVNAGTPYSSGQLVDLTVAANPVIDTTNLTAAGAPTTGLFYMEECTDPGGTSTNLPTTANGCEAATLATTPKTSSGAFNLTGASGFTMYDLPDPGTLGSATMVGICDVAPNQCVVGIFAASPQAGGGFSYPHLFSAPFNVDQQADFGSGSEAGLNPGDGSAPVITSTSATNSTVVASPTTVAADGGNTSKITVTLKDTNGNPVTSPKSVTLSQGSGHSTIEVNGSAGTAATTDGSGQAIFTVSDTTPETVTYTATDTTDTNLVLTPATPPAVTFAAPVATPSASSVSALNPSVSQTGSTTITVTLKDQGVAPQPIANKLITLTQGSGHSVIAPVSSGSDTTNAQGRATFTVSDTTPETVTYSATDTTDGVALAGQNASVTFGTLTVSATDSTVTTTSPIVSSVANGGPQPTGTVSVTLLAGTSPVPGKTVALSASSTNAVITPGSQVTGSNGQASFSVSDTTAETVTFHAVDVSDSNLAIVATTQVDFQVPAPSPLKSSMAVTPATVAADGVTAASLTVTIEDQFGNPLAGKTVTVVGSITGTSSQSTTSRVVPSGFSGSVVATTTDGSGDISFNAFDTTAESITYTATDSTDSVTVAQTVAVTFTAGVPQVSQSAVQASPSAVPADGTTASTITVTVEDHNANPVQGIGITLTALNGSSAITPTTDVVTNTSGQAAFKVTDATAESVRFRATDTTDNLPLVGEEVEVTFGTPPPTAPAVADSDIVASRTTVPADGHSSATVQVILNDGNGLPLSGKTVTLVPMSVHAVVSPATATTDSNGTASLTVTDTTPESVTFTATDVTDNAPLTGLSVTISFTSATGAASASLNKPIVGMAPTPDGKGYWLVASDGGVFTEGDAVFYGSTGAIQLNKPIVGMAPTPDGKGYWLVASDGGVFTEGDAVFYGSTGAIQLNKPIVGMAPTPDGKGYWLVASDGGVFTEGDAVFYGSTGAIQLNKPIVGMAPTPDGKGYWLVASDGGVFTEGNAVFYGSTGAIQLNKPIVGMAPTPDGKGYWLVASDGGVFTEGNAVFYGSTGALNLKQPIVGTAPTPDGKGYWLVASDGGVFTEGDAVFYGSMAG